MRFSSKEQAVCQRYPYSAGIRVELVQMDDTRTPPVSARGAVIGIDNTGSIMVDWDNGSGFSTIYGVDRCRKVLTSD